MRRTRAILKSKEAEICQSVAKLQVSDLIRRAKETYGSFDLAAELSNMSVKSESSVFFVCFIAIVRVLFVNRRGVRFCL